MSRLRHSLLATGAVIAASIALNLLTAADTNSPTVSYPYSYSFAPTMPATNHNLSARDYAVGSKRSAEVAQRINNRLKSELGAKGLTLGAPVFIRIFKQERALEVWLLDSKTQKFSHFKSYKIAAMSGKLGPKRKEGDLQAPEGFYAVGKRQMNPQSRFHLSFNLGYPNRYDRYHKRTGSALMIHGNRVSIGCFAMTDYYIEEIYTLCEAALQHGQPFFRVHSFPFQLNDELLEQHREHSSYPFWKNLQPGYLWFEKHKSPPNVEVVEGSYHFSGS